MQKCDSDSLDRWRRRLPVRLDGQLALAYPLFIPVPYAWFDHLSAYIAKSVRRGGGGESQDLRAGMSESLPCFRGPNRALITQQLVAS